MLLEIENVTVNSVWSESFTGRDGDEVEFYRALLSVPGESPLQLGVSKDDFGNLSAKMGANGTALVDLDARPGNRVRVYLKDVVS